MQRVPTIKLECTILKSALGTRSFDIDCRSGRAVAPCSSQEICGPTRPRREPPPDAVRAHDPGDLLSDLCFQCRPPRYQSESPALLNQREPTAGEIHPTCQPPFDSFPGSHLDEWLAQLAGHFFTGTKKFTPLQHHDRVRAKPDTVAIDIRKLLLGQLLLPERHGHTDVASDVSTIFSKIFLPPAS